MNIRDILSKHYQGFVDMCTHKDIALCAGKTSEDILNDCIITIINHYGDKDITEEEGYEYSKKTFLFECFFSYKRKRKEENTFLEFIPDYPQNL